MSPQFPVIFVSATTADLGSCRQSVKDALLTLDCVPAEKASFPPDAREVRAMLRARIEACHAVIHIAGEVYGAEPKNRPPDHPRRSYTQLEYEIALELRKPVYVFICGEGFPYDAHEPEDEERQRLQREHRERLLGGDQLFESVATRDDLEKRILALQTRVEMLTHELRRTRSWLGRGVAIGLILLSVLGGGLYLLNQRTTKTEVRITKVETELDRQRRYISAVANAYSEQQRQLEDLKLTDEQIFDRAVEVVAERDGIDADDLRAGIDLFVAAVRADPESDFMDRALADFAQRRFASASKNAGLAADEARTQRLAAEALAERATAQAAAARDREREALTLQGRSLRADHRFEEAVGAFDRALVITPRASIPLEWGLLQFEIGDSASSWAAASEGDAIANRRARAVDAYRAALEVYTREALPQGWATTQNNLAIDFFSQALASEGNERRRLLVEAVLAMRARGEVFTQVVDPQGFRAREQWIDSIEAEIHPLESP